MRAPAELAARAITCAYGDDVAVDALDLSVPPGRITVIVGANGCGKSTLLRALGRLIAPRSGGVVLDGRDLRSRPAKELARTLGLLPQTPLAPDGIAVADLVGRGRYPHQRLLAPWSRQDAEAVASAMTATNTTELADRCVDELSGGQRQRVWIAMALAQETDILLLDEPTTYLDLAHQLEVLDLLVDLNERRGTTIVMVLHDLNLAARYAHELVAMRAGRVHVAGPPSQVVTAAMVSEVFGLDALIVRDPACGAPLVVPLGKHHRERRPPAGG